jgi:hypothetical protein
MGYGQYSYYLLARELAQRKMWVACDVDRGRGTGTCGSPRATAAFRVGGSMRMQSGPPPAPGPPPHACSKHRDGDVQLGPMPCTLHPALVGVLLLPHRYYYYEHPYK